MKNAATIALLLISTSVLPQAALPAEPVYMAPPLNLLYEDREVRVRRGKMEYLYDEVGSPFPYEVVKAAITDALGLWSDRTSLSLEYAGDAFKFIVPVGDGYCMISWSAEKMPAERGITSVFVEDEEIYSCDIQLDPTLDDPAVLASVVAHQIGHSIGLGHDEHAGIMNPEPTEQARHRNIVDIAAVTYLYPRTLVEGRPVLDCSAESQGEDLYLPVVNGSFAARLQQQAETDDVTQMQWGVAELLRLDQVIDTRLFHLCG